MSSKKKKSDDGIEGVFFREEPPVREAIIIAAVKEAPQRRMRNRAAEKRQNDERMVKMRMEEEGMFKSSGKQGVTSAFFFHSYKGASCWKGSAGIVNKKLKKLKTEGDQREALKHNINIRVKGFGWKRFRTPWTRKKEDVPIKELADKLREIIKEESLIAKGKSELTIPEEPYLEWNAAKLPVLGTMTEQRRLLDEKHLGRGEELKKSIAKLSRERNERKNENSMYHYMQDWETPSIQSILQKRIDVLWPLEDNVTKKKGGSEWCQGKVDSIVSGCPRWVNVIWDARPDLPGFEESVVSEVELKENMYRKTKGRFAWRMDVDVELFDNYFDDNEEGVLKDDDAHETEVKDTEEGTGSEDDGSVVCEESEGEAESEMDWDEDELEGLV